MLLFNVLIFMIYIIFVCLFCLVVAEIGANFVIERYNFVNACDQKLVML